MSVLTCYFLVVTSSQWISRLIERPFDNRTETREREIEKEIRLVVVVVVVVVLRV